MPNLGLQCSTRIRSLKAGWSKCWWVPPVRRSTARIQRTQKREAPRLLRHSVESPWSKFNQRDDSGSKEDQWNHPLRKKVENRPERETEDQAAHCEHEQQNRDPQGPESCDDYRPVFPVQGEKGVNPLLLALPCMRVHSE